MSSNILYCPFLKRSEEVWAGLGMSRTRENSVSGSPTSAEQVSFFMMFFYGVFVQQYRYFVWRRSKFINSKRAWASKGRMLTLYTLFMLSLKILRNTKNDDYWLLWYSQVSNEWFLLMLNKRDCLMRWIGLIWHEWTNLGLNKTRGEVLKFFKSSSYFYVHIFAVNFIAHKVVLRQNVASHNVYVT